MSTFDLLADPTRRRILELLATQDQTAGAIVAQIRQETGISQPAVAQHLRALRAGGLVTVRAAGRHRWYAVNPVALREVDDWLQQFRPRWDSALDALATELARGRRSRPATDHAASPNRQQEAS